MSKHLEILTDAIINGDLVQLKKLLKCHRLPTSLPNPNNGKPLVFEAIEKNQYQITEYLLLNEIVPLQDLKDFDGNTCLMTAVNYQNAEVVNLILSRAKHLIPIANNKGKTPLLLSCELGLLEITKKLIEMGASINEKDLDGSTPLHYVSSWGHADLISLLISCGADVTISNLKGWTALDYAYSTSILAHLEGNYY
ncbi:ankyrin repeat-containing domain protein [Globomyces pollinis-pini]|nr:ankyrin repeat-containing domain protein [Globomyces pollinis-pini]KAJ3000140.1 hypothetical protein HDV02_000423 [Globomyces sp. JEL0801]